MARENIFTICLKKGKEDGPYYKIYEENNYRISMRERIKYAKVMNEMKECPFFNMIKRMPELHEKTIVEFHPESSPYIKLNSYISSIQNSVKIQSAFHIEKKSFSENMYLRLSGNTSIFGGLNPDYTFSCYRRHRYGKNALHIIKLFAYLMKQDMKTIFHEAVLPEEAFISNSVNANLEYPPKLGCLYFYNYYKKERIKTVFYVEDQDINNMRLVA